MSIRRPIDVAAAIAVIAAFVGPITGLAGSAAAQKPPAVRQLGALERMTTDSLASAATAIALADGRVLANDMTSRRLLLFDSTMAKPIVVADTTAATANAYGRDAGTLIRYRGDTALFIDVGSLSMLVIGPSGKVLRVIAVPRPDDAQMLLGVFGTPGFDARGRLVYHGTAGIEGTYVLCCVGTAHRAPGKPVFEVPKPDSAFVVRADLLTRALDTVTAIKIAYSKQRVTADAQGYIQAIEERVIPLPIVDGWATTTDGSIVVVRGRDYHMDRLDGSGHWTSFAKMPFDWKRLDDEQKLKIVDSAASTEQARREQNARRARQVALGAGRTGAPTGGGRGGGSGRGGGEPIPVVVMKADVSDVPDYAPPFGERALFADSENNVWIETTTKVGGLPVYDVVNQRGELFDRVQLPPNRTIAGFGRGVIYMAVKDSVGNVHLERARVK